VAHGGTGEGPSSPAEHAPDSAWNEEVPLLRRGGERSNIAMAAVNRVR